MAERYSKLFSLESNLYSENVPVLICAGVLTKDNDLDRVLVQLRLQNIDSKYRNITALKVAISSYDPAGNELGTAKEHQYLDLDINRGIEFGGKIPIYLDNNIARSFSVCVVEVVFADGQIWTGENGNWVSLKQKTLEEVLGLDLADQYRRDTFGEAKYEVLAHRGIWLCACGTLNTIEESDCCRCHNSKVELFKALDHNTLAGNLNTHTEKISAENEVKKIKDKKFKLTAIIVAVVILLVGIITIPKAVKVNKQKAKVNKQKAVVEALIGTTWSGHTFEDENTISTMSKSLYGDRQYIDRSGYWCVEDIKGNVMRIMEIKLDYYYYNVVFSKSGGKITIDGIYETNEDGTYRGRYLTRGY